MNRFLTRVHGWLVRFNVRLWSAVETYRWINETVDQPDTLTDYGLMMFADAYKEPLWALFHFPNYECAQYWIEVVKKKKSIGQVLSSVEIT